MKRLSRVAPVIVAMATLLIAVGGRAQVSSSDLDHVHDELDAARARVEAVQGKASTVAKQIESLDEQVAAVTEALETTQRLAADTQAEIGALRLQVRDTKRSFDRVQGQAIDIAVSLYKAGATGQLEPLLSSRSLTELADGLEYSTVVSRDQARVMIDARRLEAELSDQTADLESKLQEILVVKKEQETQAQHLRELRVAQRLKLVDLRKRIRSERAEADALVAESAAIEAQLAQAAPAPVAAVPDVAAPVGVGSSGFAWPINGAVTSGYGPRWGRMHEGIDIDCVTGAPIRASKDGTVVSSTYDDGYGNHVVLDHGGGLASLYAHMSELYVSGGSISQGEAVGACGSTGASTGDHLHFEIRANGAPQDPMNYLP